jgi:hypothetical protein
MEGTEMRTSASRRDIQATEKVLAKVSSYINFASVLLREEDETALFR